MDRQTFATEMLFACLPAVRLLVIAWAAMASACFDSPSFEGRACDRTSPCPKASGLICSPEGVCVNPDTFDSAANDAGVVNASNDGAIRDDGGFGDAAPADDGAREIELVDANLPDGSALDGDDGDAGGADAVVVPNPDASEGMDADAGTGIDAACDIRVNGAGAYCTISDAVAAAPSGATVSIPARTFSERVVVTAPVRLVGGGSGTTGPVTTVFGTSGGDAAVEIRASNVEIQDLVVSGLVGGISVVAGATAVSLHDLRVAQTTGFGVSASGASVVTLTNAVVADALAGTGIGREGNGVHATGGAQVNIVASSILRSAADGIHVDSAIVNVHASPGRSTLIEANGGRGLFTTGSSARVYVKPDPDGIGGFGGITVRLNRLSALHAAGGYARFADNTIIGDNGAAAPQHGISFIGTGEYYAKRNNVSGATGYGMFCDPSGSTVICDSTDPNIFSGNALGSISAACPATCE